MSIHIANTGSPGADRKDMRATRPRSNRKHVAHDDITPQHRILRPRKHKMTVADNCKSRSHCVKPSKRPRLDHTEESQSTTLSPARVLLYQAQQCVQLDTDWLGRRPAIMDIILNAMSQATEYREDMLTNAIQRRLRRICPVQRHYAFTDEESLNEYWDDQAAFWKGVQSAPDTATRFEVSAERSTASM